MTKTYFQEVHSLGNVFLACKSRIKPFAEVSDLSHLTAKPFRGLILLNLASKSAITGPQPSHAEDFDPNPRGLMHRSRAGVVTKTYFQEEHNLGNVFLAC